MLNVNKEQSRYWFSESLTKTGTEKLTSEPIIFKVLSQPPCFEMKSAERGKEQIHDKKTLDKSTFCRYILALGAIEDNIVVFWCKRTLSK